MSDLLNEIEAAKARRESSVQDARDQAQELDGFTADETYTTPTGVPFGVPNVGLLDDDQQERFDALNFKFSKCDKVPDGELPGRTVTAKDPDGTEVVTEYPPSVIKGTGFLQPYQTDGQLVVPNYNIQLVIALLGEEGYEEFKAAKGKSSEFADRVKKLAEKLAEREKADPKSEGGSAALADVPD
jgi:hypothetical protein